ncbi:NlpC/P60 family protein 2 [Bordetella genomosp. 1]|uniref:NlpC/P60 family protein 2 n=1 Tax=Bordetella genomosp. 1 TaxID=1395607 RepID=A0A261SFP5_9BORD|nr:C40 family peptidase [Bordetella genomosp. 1]MDQ8035496.1 C40 family peptidase [Bordetella sp.]OZI35762.1 NlpC/P60 family protein 2 [Bordetella genomosp. 1]OZI58426.1 NlpC/P60 family protein 2 [Bordetella genomosp. 1]
MTPPTREVRRQSSVLSAFISAPLLALCLTTFSGAAHASLHPAARASLSGLALANETTVPTLRDRVVQAGLEAIGTPYSWGGDDPDGFDCSGLTLFVYREIAGLELPRTSRAQRTAGKNVARARLKPGDLVFFATRGRGVTSHVGIYIGQGQFVHAPSRGSQVRVDRLDNTYWSKRYLGARAYLDERAPDAPLLAAASTR